MSEYEHRSFWKDNRKVTDILDELILKTPASQNKNNQLWLGKPVYDRLIAENGKMTEYRGLEFCIANVFTQEQAFIL